MIVPSTDCSESKCSLKKRLRAGINVNGATCQKPGDVNDLAWFKWSFVCLDPYFISFVTSVQGSYYFDIDKVISCIHFPCWSF